MIRIRMLLRTQLLALLTALAIALPLGAAGRDRYFCHVMGRTLSSCCCSGAKGSPDIHAKTVDTRIEKSNCCTVVDGEVAPTISVTRNEATHFQPPLAAIRVPFFEGIPGPNLHALIDDPVRARAPPGSGPPLFLKNCSFLT